MTADEMFKELGYEKDDTPLLLGNEKIPHITYFNDGLSRVYFNLKKKYFAVDTIYKNYKELLKAINKKVEELGW